jgi:toxin ParE1/3/4
MKSPERRNEMARIELAPEVVQDFDRILEYQTQYKIADAVERIKEIIEAIDVLAHNPLIGRPVAGGKRELVIGRRGRGYIALYKYVEELDAIFVLAVRSQRETGYSRT